MTQEIPFIAEPDEFRGKVALVTGGTNGLGRHLTLALTSLGTDVFFCGRDKQCGQALESKLGAKAHFIACDLQDCDATTAFVEQVGQFTGKIDYLVNNAAIDDRVEFMAATKDDFDRLIAVNLRALFIVSQAALPLLEASDGKAIVNISTTNYFLGLVPFTIYNASKAGILGFSRSLAREVGPLGIRVNTLSPGWIMTQRQLAEHVTQADKKELLDAQSLKFLLGEQHVTPALIFLLSRAAGGITGQNIVVDGGKVMQ